MTIEANSICRVLCRAEGTAQCAPICLSHFSLRTTDGQCPEASHVWKRKAEAVVEFLQAGNLPLANQEALRDLVMIFASRPDIWRLCGFAERPKVEAARQLVNASLEDHP